MSVNLIVFQLSNYFIICITVPKDNIILVFKDDTQKFERCVQILESVKTQIKVEAITESVAKGFIATSNRLSIQATPPRAGH